MVVKGNITYSCIVSYQMQLFSIVVNTIAYNHNRRSLLFKTIVQGLSDIMNTDWIETIGEE